MRDSTYYCTRDQRPVPMENCVFCEHIRKEDDISSIWCRYRIGRTEETQPEWSNLVRMAGFKREEAVRCYKIGREERGDKLMKEAYLMEKQAKELRENE